MLNEIKGNVSLHPPEKNHFGITWWWCLVSVWFILRANLGWTTSGKRYVCCISSSINAQFYLEENSPWQSSNLQSTSGKSNLWKLEPDWWVLSLAPETSSCQKSQRWYVEVFFCPLLQNYFLRIEILHFFFPSAWSKNVTTVLLTTFSLARSQSRHLKWF